MQPERSGESSWRRWQNREELEGLSETRGEHRRQKEQMRKGVNAGNLPGVPGTSWSLGRCLHKLGKGLLGRQEWEAERSPGRRACRWVSVLQAGGPEGVIRTPLSLWKGDWKGMRLPVRKL